ncbi:MAG: HAMP domain-containing histidine kinase [Actinomycetota bacterium]|nr:HAMP domain-containing histidine kinase [Actinomycetota bacterium]
MEDARFAELISRIAHELRSPLTSVKGFSATLVKRWDRFTDEQRFQFVESIHQDAERMARIISEVLDLAKLETGKLELHREGTEVRKVATHALDHLATLPGAERVEVEIDEACIAWADPVRLQHVLFNLLENAIKYSETGPVRITAAGADGTVEVVVADEGVGIDPARFSTLFDGPAPPGQAATPSGTGLGLLLTRRIVEAHGGTISVESAPPGGSTFTVRLPANAGNGQPD